MAGTPLNQKPSFQLTAKDEIQYLSDKNEWLPLPVVEEGKPSHPCEVSNIERHRKNTSIENFSFFSSNSNTLEH